MGLNANDGVKGYNLPGSKSSAAHVHERAECKRLLHVPSRCIDGGTPERDEDELADAFADDISHPEWHFHSLWRADIFAGGDPLAYPDSESSYLAFASAVDQSNAVHDANPDAEPYSDAIPELDVFAVAKPHRFRKWHADDDAVDDAHRLQLPGFDAQRLGHAVEHAERFARGDFVPEWFSNAGAIAVAEPHANWHSFWKWYADPDADGNPVYDHNRNRLSGCNAQHLGHGDEYAEPFARCHRIPEQLSDAGAVTVSIAEPLGDWHDDRS